MGLLVCIGLGVRFGVCAGIPLYWAVDPVRDLAEGDEGWFGVRFTNMRLWGMHEGWFGGSLYILDMLSRRV